MACNICLVPPYGSIEPGWNFITSAACTGPVLGVNNTVASQPGFYQEYINFNLPQNQALVTIPFQSSKANSNITDRGLRIYNSVDATQMVPTFNIVTTSTTAMTILLSALLPTKNYFLKGLVGVVV